MNARVVKKFRYFLFLLVSFAVAGCGMDDDAISSQDEYGPQWEMRRGALTDFCEIDVQGYGTLDVEDEYLAKVVSCEAASGASMEALKAQAIAARGYAKFVKDVQGRTIDAGISDQHYDCGRGVRDDARQAVLATSGQVLTHNGKLIMPFYVAGTTNLDSNTCRPTGNGGFESRVTYNEGLIGDSVHPAQRPHGDPNNPANRGVMSQNGAACLSDNGWSAERILRFYYGDDARIAQLYGSCVDTSGGGTGNSGGGDVSTCGADWEDGNATQFGYNDPVDNGMGAFGDDTDNKTLKGVSLPQSVVTAALGTSRKSAARDTNVLVIAPNGKKGVFPIVDRGPAMYIYNQNPTIDLTYAAVKELGYTPSENSSSFKESGFRWNILTDADDDCPATTEDANNADDNGGGGGVTEGNPIDDDSGDTNTCDVNAAQPDIITRSEWGAKPPKYNRQRHSPNRFTIHHTVTSNSDSNPAQTMRAMQRDHMARDNNTWADIGYHFVLDQQGRIYAANPVDRVGAHVGGGNTNNIGIAFMGNYNSAQPSEVQLASAGALVRYLANKYSISVDSDILSGHRDHGGTQCPGSNLYAQIDRIAEYARGNDASCDEDSSDDGGGSNDAPVYRYVRVRATSDLPLGSNDTVEGFELDSVSVETSAGESRFANAVRSSSGATGASSALGRADNTSCDNRSSTVAGITTSGEVVVKVDGGFGPGDAVNIVQVAYGSMSNCAPSGTAQLAISPDGSSWTVISNEVTGNASVRVPAAFIQITTPDNGTTHEPDVHFAVNTSPSIAHVEYVADGSVLIGESSNGPHFEIDYTFNYMRVHPVVASGYDSNGNLVATDTIEIITQYGGGGGDPALSGAMEREGGICSGVGNGGGAPRCSGGVGGYSTADCWAYVKAAMIRAGLATRSDINELASRVGMSGYSVQVSAAGFKRAADRATTSDLADTMHLRKTNIPPTQAPAGAVIAWGPGCLGAHSQYGHIEVAQSNGNACSDYCSPIRGDASCASVYVPID